MSVLLTIRRNIKITYSHARCLSQTLTKEQIKRKLSEWESVIGLEIHAQISSKAKLFSGAATPFAAPINSQVAFLDAALPGTLPVLNQRCVEAGVLTALALNCRLNMVSRFDRKHYFYADLPAGYQITQQRQPLAVQGRLDYLCPEPDSPKRYEYRTARITQLQLEQDSGKSLHDGDAQISLIDLNRAGIGLMEIVTEPDFRSSQEAAAFVKELQLILQTLGSCDGKMAEGSLRVDASVSLRRPGEELGVRAEVKNINSIRNVAKAIDYEITRQKEILESGKEVQNETRAYDFETETTIAMRDKEKVHDYRFLPEPNLPPLVLHTTETLPEGGRGGTVNVDDIRARMAELPNQTRQRLRQTYGISMDQSIVLVNDMALRNFFEEMADGIPQNSVKSAINLLLNDLLGLLNKNEIEIDSSPITPSMLGEIAEMMESGMISSKISKKLMEELLTDPRSPRQVVKDNNWAQITNPALLEAACEEVLRENADSVEAYIKGKKKVFNFLIGQLQKRTEGRAEPKQASKIMKEQLDNLKAKSD